MLEVPPRPLLPVLWRMSLGLALVLLGALLASRGITVRPTPGIGAQTTPVRLPLDGPLPLDLASSATLRLSGDRASVRLGPLPASSAQIADGRVLHRGRNPVAWTVARTGRAVSAALGLRVPPVARGGVVVGGPEPLQHRIDLSLTRGVPLTLSSETSGGDQRLDLKVLRVRALTVRTLSGGVDLTLPARPAGPLSVITAWGEVRAVAPRGAEPEALRVNTQGGDVRLDLAPMRTQALAVGTLTGDVRLTLPTSVQRGSVTTDAGDVEVTAPPALSAGNLDIRTRGGGVALRVPRDLRVRVRFTDRDTITLPPGTPPATAPQLDVFVDASAGPFSLTPYSAPEAPP